MRSALRGLLRPLVRAAAIIAAALVFFREGGLLEQWSGAALPYLVTPFVVAAALDFAAEAARVAIAALAPPKPKTAASDAADAAEQPSPPRWRTLLASVPTLLRGSAWLTFVYWALSLTPRIVEDLAAQPDLTALQGALRFMPVFSDAAPLAVALAAPWVLVRGAAKVWGILDYLLPTPHASLIGLAALYGLLAGSGPLAVAFDFHGFGFFVASAVAFALAYAAGVAERASDFVATTRAETSGRWRAASRVLDVLALPIGALGAAVFVWGGLEVLPEVNAALLSNDGTASAGRDGISYFREFHGIRYFAAGLAFLVLTARGTRLFDSFEVGPFVRAALLLLAAVLSWTTAAELEPLGYGYAIIGAVLAGGLVALALGSLGRYTKSAPSPTLNRLGFWLDASGLRTFAVGGSLALYGLLLRPVVYGQLQYAALLEWLVVVVVAILLLSRARDTEPGAEPRAIFPTLWRRHSQQVHDLPDGYLLNVVGLQQRFLASGDWLPYWSYSATTMFRNDVSLDAIASALQPFAGYRPPKEGGLLWERWFQPSPEAAWSEREGMRREVSRRIADAMALPQAPPPGIDITQVREAAGRFVQHPAHAMLCAVTGMAAAWQRGARLDTAAMRWRRIASYVEERPGWGRLPGLQDRARARLAERRRALVEAEISRLAGEESASTRTVVVSEPVLVSLVGRPGSAASRLVPAGELLEILGEDRGQLHVRTVDGAEGLVPMARLTTESGVIGDRYGYVQR